ncbi:NAD(P)-binding protein [Microcystis aeruginosa LEGE 11464]|uniref:NAD(P)/FAD-dependent oxidoreductase n=1 Tax=Microcystis aeruginosa TaxID=1126 RepID=UPI0018809FB5|nr:NAD(P)-binding protein [Microcystis aeruginosa]MBE9091339.1 NAD(P)-binding protein [Microcystis aeruginosa LEGE 11464]
MTNFSIKVGIIGAGLAGLTCARQLCDRGYTVKLFDKSRGIGGRLATRRVNRANQEMAVDHGLPFLTVQGEKTAALIDNLLRENIVTSWFDSSYVAPSGINSVAKFLAQGLEIERDFLVTRLENRQGKWVLNNNGQIRGEFSVIVLAIPAPQAALLLENSHITTMPELRSIVYDPCLTVMAGYGASLPAVAPSTAIAWLGLDSSKRQSSFDYVFVVHSSGDFAVKYLDSEDLEAVKLDLLARASLPLPDWSQIHRWRYALVRQGLAVPCLSVSSPLPLVACGDWCQGGDLSRNSSLETALTSGIAAANQVQQLLS